MFAFIWNTRFGGRALLQQRASANSFSAAQADTLVLQSTAANSAGFIAPQDLNDLLKLLRSSPAEQKISYPNTLYQLILQLKENEAPFLGTRLHSTIPEKKRDFLLEEDILGYGFIVKTTLEDIMLSFLLVLCCCRGDVDDTKEFSENTEHKSFNPFASPNVFRYQGQLPENPELLSRTWYVRNYQLFLRRLILNNPYIACINQNKTSKETWAEWDKLFIDGNTNNNVKDVKEEDLRHLHHEDFKEFARKISLLQNWILQREGLDRAWYSSFIFPHGPSFFYAEIDQYLISSANYLSYLAMSMFSFMERAGSSGKMLDLGGGNQESVTAVQSLVGNELKIRFCNKNNPLNKIARKLSGPHAYSEDVALEYIHSPDFGWQDSSNFELNNIDQFRSNFSTFCKSEAKKRALDDGYEPSLVNKINSYSHAALNLTPYCPVREHKIYCQLLEDFGRLVKMDINNQDLFRALGHISILNMMVYGLEQARGALALSNEMELKRDINIIPVLNLNSNDRGIRQSSVMRCKENNELNVIMLKPYMQMHFKKFVTMLDPALLEAESLSTEQINEIFHLVSALFTFNEDGQHFLLITVYLMLSNQWKANQDNLSRKNRKNSLALHKTAADLEPFHLNYERLTDAIWEAMLNQSRSNVNYHHKFGENIGLISSKITRGHCYYLSDDLLKSLVMSVVGCSDHMLLSEFLENLEQRYHIIIGPKEAHKYYDNNNKSYNLPLRNLENEFTKNENGLKEQLSRLGLLKSLSDACEFVHNPFYQGQSEKIYFNNN